MVRMVLCLCWMMFTAGSFASAAAQQSSAPLDPARAAQALPFTHTSLPEQYIWTAGDITAQRPDHSHFPWREQEKRTARHLFRASFQVPTLPVHAELYIAGPREADVFLNGHRLAHFASDIDAPIGFQVFRADATALLQMGANELAIAAVRGRGIVTADSSLATQQLAYGEILAVKVVAAPPGNNGPELLISNGSWRSRTDSAAAEESPESTPPWATANFNDAVWQPVASLGPVESNRDFFQWSADAGMYAWPGYLGVSAPLQSLPLRPVAVTHIFAGQASLEHVEALSAAAPSSDFSVITSAKSPPTDAGSPAILLDFGREIAGRLLVQSDADQDAVLSIAYGESELEAVSTGLTPQQRGGNYLGTNLLLVPAHGTARGPKSGFRYVRIRFLRGPATLRFGSIGAEAIVYPVHYTGSFQSSDPLLNRIWETAAYTAHLCMQDDLWDAPKRDRGRWAGDIDVEGRVISDVFGKGALLERTLGTLAPSEGKAVNGIPGYSALWVTSLASLYDHTGDLSFLQTQHAALLRVLATMEASLNSEGIYAARKGEWPFVDWSPGLYGSTPGAVFGTTLQYARGFLAAEDLFKALGDSEGAAQCSNAARRLLQTAGKQPQARAMQDTSGTGVPWQLAALGVQSGLLATPEAQQAIWESSLSHVKQDSPGDQVISPYFNLAVLDAMAQLGHAHTALDWMRTYWGGMLAEGATSFWEAYDLRWPKDTPHLSLQADGTSGFFVSMAHGWSSGPAAWLAEQVLGVRDPQDGYRTVTIAPRLLGLAWAHGAVPTPHGPIRVSIAAEKGVQRVELEIPAGVQQANITLEPNRSGTPVLVDGRTVQPIAEMAGDIRLPPLGTGKHEIRYTPAGL